MTVSLIVFAPILRVYNIGVRYVEANYAGAKLADQHLKFISSTLFNARLGLFSNKVQHIHAEL